MNKIACNIIVVVVILCGAALLPQVADSQQRLTGSYLVYAAEKQIQTDKYEISPGENVTDDFKIQGTDEHRRIETGLKSGIGGYYQKILNGVPEMRASVDKDLISFYEHEAMVGALPVEQYVMFFDPTAYGHYGALLKYYDAAAGGKQLFTVVVPALQDYCQVEVERHGSDVMNTNGKSLNAAHYRMVLGKKESANVWTDQRRVIALHLPTKGLFVVDASYTDMLKEIKRVVSKSL